MVNKLSFIGLVSFYASLFFLPLTQTQEGKKSLHSLMHAQAVEQARAFSTLDSPRIASASGGVSAKSECPCGIDKRARNCCPQPLQHCMNA